MSFIGPRRTLLTAKRAFAFDFLSATLPQGAELTRADASTCATYVDNTGLIKTAAANVPRWTYDPVTHALQGLLIEPSDSNGCSDSENFGAVGWVAAGDATLGANAVTSPDGAVDAGTVTEGSLTANRRANFSSANLMSGLVYPITSFAKSVTGARWYQPNIGGAAGLNVNPNDGSIGSVSQGTVTGATATQLPNGWWRFGALYTATATGAFQVRLYMASGNGGNAPSYAGDGTSTLGLWGLHVGNAGGPITSYIKTSGGAATRGADVLTLPVPNGNYTAIIERLSGVTTLLGQNVTAVNFTVPTDPSPLRRITLRKVS